MSAGPGRIQIEKYCLAPGIVRDREGAHPLLDEVLDVGVIAVIQPALAAQVLHQLAVERPVLAEVRVGDGQGVEVVVAAGHVDREADRDGRRVGRLLDDRHLQPLGHAGRRAAAGHRGPRTAAWRSRCSTQAGRRLVETAREAQLQRLAACNAGGETP